MPGVSVTSSTAASLRGLFRSITSPASSVGASVGSTSAVQPVEVSPSIARLGSPKSLVGWALGLYVAAASVSSRIASGWDSPAEPEPAAVVLVLVEVFVVAGEEPVVPVVVGIVTFGTLVGMVAFGVIAVSGIFGGLTVPSPSAGLIVVGVPSVFGGVGVVRGAAGLPVLGALVRTTVALSTRALCVPLLRAAYPAVAAASARTATAPMIAAAGRQLGAPRLPGAPAPHCMHQSWPAAIAAPQFAQIRCTGAAGGEPADVDGAPGADPSAGAAAGGGEDDDGESASNVATNWDSSFTAARDPA